MSRLGRHAVVLGGGVAGLCAARVAAQRFKQVTLLERDVYPERPAGRHGVPQDRHGHGLLERGRRQLETLFPGFTERMIARGAEHLDFGTSFAALRPYGWQRREPLGYRSIFASRPLIESVVRELLRDTPGVSLGEATTATHLEIGGVPLRVTGVGARERGGATKLLRSDFVIDCSGRRSPTLEWLADSGLAPPRETVVDAFIGYSTRWFRRPPRDRWPPDWWWTGIWIDATPPEQQLMGILFPIEDDQWMVSLAAAARHYPPSDEAGYTAALGTLRSPLIAEAVRLATPITKVYGMRSLPNRLRHFETWRRPPAGLAILGDAACVFNPLYAQGMTVAACCASLLGECLDRFGAHTSAAVRAFYRLQARFLRDPWSLASGVDLMFPETEGDRPAMARVMAPYTRALRMAAGDDPIVKRRAVEVNYMLRPASALFTPPILARVARATLARRLGPPRDPALPLPS